MKSMNAISSRESGAVAIFTVVFFMIFISILCVSFIKIVADEQQAVADGDLSASALAAAQGGVEDGKRLIALCRETSDPGLRAECDSVFGATNCDAITGNTALRGALGIRVTDPPGDPEGIVDTNNEDYLQRYTCLTIETDTPSVEGITLEPRSSEIIPLDAVDNGGNPVGFTQFDLSWHELADGANGPATVGPVADQPTKNAWAGFNYPAMMRVQLMYHQEGDVDLDDLNNSVQTIFLTPASVGIAYPSAVNINTYDPNPPPPATKNLQRAAGSQNARVNVRCDTAPTSGFACRARVRLQVPPPVVEDRDYYLRLTAIYRDADIKVELFNNNTLVNFNNVQPAIDSTGRTNDVFRRVESRVQYNAPVYLPEYAIETGGPICKDILSTGQNTGSADRCTY